MLSDLPDKNDRVKIEWAINFYTKVLKYADQFNITKEEQEQIKNDLAVLKDWNRNSEM